MDQALGLPMGGAEEGSDEEDVWGLGEFAGKAFSAEALASWYRCCDVRGTSSGFSRRAWRSGAGPREEYGCATCEMCKARNTTLDRLFPEASTSHLISMVEHVSFKGKMTRIDQRAGADFGS